MANDDFSHESLQDLKSITEYLKAITVGLQNGYLDLSDDGGQLVLCPTGLLSLELRAKRTGNRATLQLELSWRESGKSTTRAESLRVGSEPSDRHR